MRAVQKEAAGADEGWLARHTKPCGGCGARIQRNGGCNHIVCTRCRRHFCWVRPPLSASLRECPLHLMHCPGYAVLTTASILQAWLLLGESKISLNCAETLASLCVVRTNGIPPSRKAGVDGRRLPD